MTKYFTEDNEGSEEKILHKSHDIMCLSIKKARSVVFIITIALAFHCFDNNLWNRTGEPSYYQSSILPLPGLLAAPVLLFGGYAFVTDKLVSKCINKTPRDPVTGILHGAEPQDFGPADAEGAALLVHGFLGAGNNFNELPERLAEKGWRVRVMLLPGHGTNPRDLENKTTDSMIMAVRAELEKLWKSHKTVVLIGHSMGGTLSLLTAAEQGVDSIVLCAPYFGVTHKWYYLLKPETWVKMTKPVVRWVYKGDAFIMVNRTEVKDKIISYRWAPVQGLNTLTELGRRANSPGVLSRITCPVLLIHSHGDEAASPSASEKAFNAIKSSDKRAIWLERSNHHLFWDYERERVCIEIERFLGRSAD